MGGPGSGRKPAAEKPRRGAVVRWSKDIEGLAEDATAQEVFILGLRVYKTMLNRQMDNEFRLQVMEAARKWLSTQPVDLTEHTAEIRELIREVTGVDSDDLQKQV